MHNPFRKANYFYIDESGSILNDSSVFILGCIKTDTPNTIEKRLNDILLKIKKDIYYQATVKKILEQGFHAVENHPDVRTELYRIMPHLNFRAYFVILNKKTQYFKDLLLGQKEEGVYLKVLKKLLMNRLERDADNYFFLEELQFKSTTQKKLLEDYFKPLQQFRHINHQIVTKFDLNTSLADYMCYIFYSLLNNKPDDRMLQNFEIIKPKIALINFIHKDEYLNRKTGMDMKEIFKLYGG